MRKHYSVASYPGNLDGVTVAKNKDVIADIEKKILNGQHRTIVAATILSKTEAMVSINKGPVVPLIKYGNDDTTFFLALENVEIETLTFDREVEVKTITFYCL